MKKNTPDTPKIGNALFQYIRMTWSIRQIWVKAETNKSAITMNKCSNKQVSYAGF